MAELQLNDPQTLYRRWEEDQWSPFAIELSGDREQWVAMDGAQRELIHFALSSLMVAEERIATKFAGLVAADAPEEETTFLTTQLVDEARHMQSTRASRTRWWRSRRRSAHTWSGRDPRCRTRSVTSSTRRSWTRTGR